MKCTLEYEQELLISVTSQELPGFVRRGNYEDIRDSSAITILPPPIRETLSELEAAGALFRNDACAFPASADADVRHLFQNAQTLKGRDRRSFRAILAEIDTWLLKERVRSNIGSAEVRPTTTDYPDVRSWYNRRRTDGIRLLVPAVEELVGRLRAGERLVVGGYAGSYKTILLEHIVSTVVSQTAHTVLFVSSSRSSDEVRARVIERSSTGGVGDNGKEEVARVLTKVQVVGAPFIADRDHTVGDLRQLIEDVLHESDGMVVLAIDSLDELARAFYPPKVKGDQAIASLVALLEHLSDQWGEKLTVVSTFRFTESTYLRLHKRVIDWDWKRRQAGFGLFDIANRITARKIKTEQQSELLHQWEEAANEKTLGPDYEKLRKEHESQMALLSELEKSIQVESADNALLESASPRGRYLVSAFQEPPEIERYFDVCLSLWTEPAHERSRPVLALVVKNRHEKTMDDPCTVLFTTGSAAIVTSPLPDSVDGRDCLDALIGADIDD